MTASKTAANSKSRVQKSTAKLVVLGLLLSAIVLVAGGCMQSGTAPQYYTGIKGLELIFPYDGTIQTFDNDTFFLGIIVRNSGPEDVTTTNPARLSINYDPKYISLASSPNANGDYSHIALQGRSRDYPIGDEEYYDFSYNTKALDSTREQVKTSLTYTLCYPYSTSLSTAVCIDAQKNGIMNDASKACTPTSYTSGEGQGGPVAITRIDPKTSGEGQNVRPSFEIYIENLGDGYVLNSPDGAYHCDFSKLDNNGDWNQITVKANLSGTELECMPKQLRLVDKNSYVRCFVKTSDIAAYSKADRNYMTVLTVQLDYGYIETATRDIEIQSQKQYSLTPFVQGVNTHCNFYEKWNGAQCVAKCEYCATNLNDPDCKPKGTFANFTFTSGFSCSCELQGCIQKSRTGDCVYGFCQPGTYCCNTASASN